MTFDLLAYHNMLRDSHINIVYSGPIWGDGVEGISTTLRKIMKFDALSLTSSKSVFAVFIEQMNNMLMYSAEREPMTPSNDNEAVSRGIFVLGVQDKQYFLQSGNIIQNEAIALLREKIDHLNTLDKDGLKKLYKEQMHSENKNATSQGAGIGLTEIARRASSKISYSFSPYGDGVSFFTLAVAIGPHQ